MSASDPKNVREMGIIARRSDEQPQDGGGPCAICYCRGCTQCVTPSPPHVVCFCRKAFRAMTGKAIGEQPQDERDDIYSTSAAANLRTWLDTRGVGDTLGRDVRAVLDNREMWRNLALSRGVNRDKRDGAEFQLGHGGAWCTACRRPMREGTPVITVPAVVCKPCGDHLTETAGRLDPSRLPAEQQHDDGYDGGCDDCLCCTRAGCHTRSDATCPTNSLGESVCPCTGE